MSTKVDLKRSAKPGPHGEKHFVSLDPDGRPMFINSTHPYTHAVIIKLEPAEAEKRGRGWGMLSHHTRADLAEKARSKWAAVYAKIRDRYPTCEVVVVEVSEIPIPIDRDHRAGFTINYFSTIAAADLYAVIVRYLDRKNKLTGIQCGRATEFDRDTAAGPQFAVTE